MGRETGEFERLDGLPGRIYVPRVCGDKKHPCRDCFECQQCSDSRCAVCRESCGREGRKEPPGGQATNK